MARFSPLYNLSLAAIWGCFITFSCNPLLANSSIKVGLFDLHGKEIVPCEFSRGETLGDGFFLFSDPSDVGADETPNKHLFNSQGKEISYYLPAGTRLVSATLPDYALKRPYGDGACLPGGSLELVRGSHGYGLVRANGRILLEAKYTQIVPLGCNLFAVQDVSGLSFCFDGAGARRISDLEVSSQIERNRRTKKSTKGGQKQLCDGVFLSTRSPDDRLVAVDSRGRQLFEFPQGVRDYKESLGLIQCYIQKDSRASRSHVVIIALADGKVLFETDKAILSHINNGVSAVACESDGLVPGERLWTVVSKSGVLLSNLPAARVDIVSADRLMIYRAETSIDQKSRLYQGE